MEKYCKTIENKLMVISSEAEKWTKKQNRNNLGEKWEVRCEQEQD